MNVTVDNVCLDFIVNCIRHLMGYTLSCLLANAAMCRTNKSKSWLLITVTLHTCINDVKHALLFDTLVKRGVPLYIIRIIRFWYTSQTMYVRWNNVMSSGFKVTNGVRQGGIYPRTYFVYMPTNLAEC